MAIPVLPASAAQAVSGDGRITPTFYVFLSELAKGVRGAGFVLETPAAPTTEDVPDGEIRIVRNKTDLTLKLYANDGGVLKSITFI